MVRVPTHRIPTHPGEMLLEEFLNPMGLTQRQLADAIRVPYQRINEIVNGRRGVTPQTALRLAKYFGVSADFWMNLQLRYDLYHAQEDEAGELKKIRHCKAPAGSEERTASTPSLGEFDELIELARKQPKVAGMKRSDVSRATSAVRKQTPRSPLDVPSIRENISTRELVDVVRKERRRARGWKPSTK